MNEFQKNDSYKIQYDLIPPNVLQEIAIIFSIGSNKYEENNWKKCNDLSRYISAAYRHIEQYRLGIDYDDETGKPHLAHAITNLMFLLWFQLNDTHQQIKK